MKPTDSHSPTDFAWTADRLLGIRRCVVRSLFGKKHWATPWVMGLCDADLSFLAHLADQPRGYVHFLCLVKLALHKRAQDDRASIELAHWIRLTGKKEILRSLSYPNGTVGVLSKLGKKPLPEHSYHDLVRVLANERICKYVHHIKKIRNFHLLMLEGFCEYIPEEFRCKGVMDCITNYDEYNTLFAYTRMMRHLNIKMTPAEIHAETKMLKCIENLESWFQEKCKRALFPSPPWEGNERIKPVRSLEELKAVASKFENCVRQYVFKAALGYECFYVCEDTPAVIHLVKDVVLGWGIDQIAGVRNKQPSFAQRRELIRAFAEVDIHPVGLSYRLQVH